MSLSLGIEFLCLPKENWNSVSNRTKVFPTQRKEYEWHNTYCSKQILDNRSSRTLLFIKATPRRPFPLTIIFLFHNCKIWAHSKRNHHHLLELHLQLPRLQQGLAPDGVQARLRRHWALWGCESPAVRRILSKSPMRKVWERAENLVFRRLPVVRDEIGHTPWRRAAASREAPTRQVDGSIFWTELGCSICWAIFGTTSGKLGVGEERG
jgi:hypothetical protein